MKPNKPMAGIVGLATAMVALCSCSNEMDFDRNESKKTVTAEIIEPAQESRSCVDSETLGLGFLGMLWEPGDKIGVYGTADNNVAFTNEATSNARKTTFSGQSKGMIQYAYYPWSEANNGVAVEQLKGTLPEEQTVHDNHHIDAEYKYGKAENGTFDTEVKFYNLLSLARMEINASGTDLSSESIKSISFSATRNGQPVKMSGDFTFNATNGEINTANTTGTVTKAVWTDGKALTSHITGFISILPTLKNGDKLTVELLTDKQKVTFNVTIAVDFAAGTVYTFPLSLKTYQDNPTEYGWVAEPVTPEYEVKEGTFTCAALNVDGLPSLVNKDGPGKEGTKTLSQRIANTGWDFFAASEDFEYDNELKSSLTAYNSGKYRGSVGLAQIGGKKADTDGLNFFWKKDGISAANETMIEFNDAEGGLSDGANTCIKKGFRHYEVTVGEGVVVDVYITHMNTYSGSGNTESNAYVKAVLSQLRQLRDYVLAKMQETKRPAIVMGDTNMRYTRHNIKSNLVDVIPDGITFNDPWVDFHRGGRFPDWNSKSLMIRSKFAGDTENDIVCSDDQRGEVVDKIWYFNLANADVQISATDFYNDVSDNFVKSSSEVTYNNVTAEDANGNILENQSVTYDKKEGIADHFPVVAKFKYTYKKTKTN